MFEAAAWAPLWKNLSSGSKRSRDILCGLTGNFSSLAERVRLYQGTVSEIELSFRLAFDVFGAIKAVVALVGFRVGSTFT